MCSEAPDTTAQTVIASKQADLSQEQLDWMKQIYSESAPERQNAIDRANLVSDKQLEAMDQQSKLTQDYADYQEKTYRPLEKGIVNDALSYDSKGNTNLALGKVVSDVNQSFGAARDATTRNMTRMGVNPASGAFAAGQQQLDAQQALAQIQGMNGARENIKTQSYARKMDAANLGRGLASNQATSAGIALNQGNSAVANGQVGGNVMAQGVGMMNSGFAGAQQGFAGSASTYNNISGLNKTDNSGAMQGAGAAIGGIAMAI